jgi:hypothetical protein
MIYNSIKSNDKMIYDYFVQSLAVIAVIFYLASYHAKTRKGILAIQSIGALIWTTHFILMSAWTGALMTLTGGAFTIVFLFKGKNKFLSKDIVMYVSILTLGIFTYITWTGIHSLFPFLGVSSIMFAKWQNKPNTIRALCIPNSVLWIFYDLVVKSYGSIIAESLIIGSILLSLVWKRGN